MHLRHLVCVCSRISIILPSDYYYHLRVIRTHKDISDCRGGRVPCWRERRFQLRGLICENKVFVHPNLSLMHLLFYAEAQGHLEKGYRERGGEAPWAESGKPEVNRPDRWLQGGIL